MEDKYLSLNIGMSVHDTNRTVLLSNNAKSIFEENTHVSTPSTPQLSQPTMQIQITKRKDTVKVNAFIKNNHDKI
jgi:hypothetical protein